MDFDRKFAEQLNTSAALQNMMVELVTYQKDCFSLYLGQISNLNFATRLQNMKMYLGFSVVVQIT